MSAANVIGSTQSVVSSRVVGSANPIASKFRDIKQAFAGVGCGFLLVIVSFVLIWNSLNGVEAVSKIVSALNLVKSEQLGTEQGQIKLQGVPIVNKTNDLMLSNCSDLACVNVSPATTAVSNVYFYQVNYQRYEVKEEVTTEVTSRVVNGQEVQDEIKKTTYKEDWISKSDESVWSDFNIGKVHVVAANAKNMTNMQEKTVDNIKIPNFNEPLQNYGQVVSSKVGTTRAVIEYLPVGDKEFIVVGKLVGDQIVGGNPFIVTDKSDAELIKTLQDSENTQRTMLIVGAWLACFIGFSMIFAPILELVNWIPLFGGAAKAAAGVLAFVLATVIVLIGYLFLKFWYIFIALAIITLVLAIFLIVKKLSSKK